MTAQGIAISALVLVVVVISMLCKKTDRHYSALRVDPMVYLGFEDKDNEGRGAYLADRYSQECDSIRWRVIRFLESKIADAESEDSKEIYAAALEICRMPEAKIFNGDEVGTLEICREYYYVEDVGSSESTAFIFNVPLDLTQAIAELHKAAEFLDVDL
ncbi:MAG: hypothetical protein Q7S32_03065 [bacterium]|nr:hypothetical protein [bacterium]